MSRVRQVAVPDFSPEAWEEVATGVLLVDTMPATNGPIVLRLNGEYLLRAAWPEHVGAANEIEWHVDQPQDKEDFRTVLQIAAVVAAIIPGFQAAAPYLAAASFAYNLLVPPTQPPEQEAGKPVFSAQLSGNQARLDDPIPRTCGVDRKNPPFAAQPYFEYNTAGDQYYYGIFCLGYGPVDLLAEFIGRTPVGNFSDITIHQKLGPGVNPSIALANVVSSREAGGQEMTAGRYIGPFVACQPNRTINSIGYDIFAAQGLGLANGDPVEVTWQVEYQQIDDGGAPLADWELLDTGSFNMNTNTPVRRSFKRSLPMSMRVQVRFARTNLKSTESSTRDGIELGGMRAYLEDAAPLNPLCSHYEIVLRASEQLTAASQTDFNIILQGKCRTWTPSDGWSCALEDFDNYTAERNPAWWIADLWSDPNWGEGLADERIDLQTLYDLSLVLDDRQDRFDYTFEAATDAWAAGQLIASAGRARMFRRSGSVRSLSRDELVESAEDAITPRMCVAGSEMTISENLPSSTDPDGIIVEYQSNRTWDVAQIECPCPGVAVMTRPVYQSYQGIRGFHHAKREGLYHAADMALRRRTMTAKVEMQAIRATVLQPYRFLPQIPGYGQTGDVVSWDLPTLTMSLTERPDFSGGETYLRLRRDDGSVTAPVVVTSGAGQFDIVLPGAPDFDIVTDDGTRERPVFLLGQTTGDELVKVASVKPSDQSPKGAQYYEIEFVADDDAVHTADNGELPGPGDIQDPILLPSDDPTDGSVYIVNLNPPFVGPSSGKLLAASSGGDNSELQFLTNGTTFKLSNMDGSGTVPTVWMLFGTVDPSVAALYEIRFTWQPGVYPPIEFGAGFPNMTLASLVPPNIGDALDTWHAVTATRMVGFDTTAGYRFAAVLIEIRKIGATALSGSGLGYLYHE